MFAPEILTPAARSKLAHEATDTKGPALVFPASIDTAAGTVAGSGQITKSFSGVERSHVVSFLSPNDGPVLKASLDHDGNLIRVSGAEDFAPLKPEQIIDAVLRSALSTSREDFKLVYSEREFREAGLRHASEAAQKNSEPHELSWGKRPSSQQLQEICELLSALQFEPYTRQLSIDPSFVGADIANSRPASILAYKNYNVVVCRNGKGLSVTVGDEDIEREPFQLLRLHIQGIQNGVASDFEIGELVRQAHLPIINRSAVLRLKASVIEEPAEISAEQGVELFATLRERLGTGDSYSTLGESNLSPIIMVAPLGASDEAIGYVFINHGAARSCRVFEDGRVEVVEASDICTFEELLQGVASGIASVHPSDSVAGSLCRGVVHAYCTGEALETNHLEYFTSLEDEDVDPVTAEELRRFFETTALSPTKTEQETLQKLVAEPFQPSSDGSEIERTQDGIILLIRSEKDSHSNIFSQVSIRAYRNEGDSRVPLDLEYAQIQVASLSAERQHPLSKPGYYLGEVTFTDLRTDWRYKAYLP